MRELLIGTRELATQLSGLVDDNEAQLGPALEDLDRVATILKDNRDNIDDSLRLLAPYFRLVTATMGNGGWLDAYVCGLFDEDSVPVIDSEALRDCDPGRGAP